MLALSVPAAAGTGKIPQPASSLQGSSSRSTCSSQDACVRNGKKKRKNRRRRKNKSRNKVEPVEKPSGPSKRPHDAPMTKGDLYFSLHCEMVSVGLVNPVVARVTMFNWDAEPVLDTCVQVPVPVTDFRNTGLSPEDVSSANPNAMALKRVRYTVKHVLKGKILIGYHLQDHLTALCLSHPESDMRDVAKFQPFSYKEVDGVSNEAILVERSLDEIALEHLNRELHGPADACLAAFELYKNNRKEWEQAMIAESKQKPAQQLYNPSTPTHSQYSFHPNAAETRPRLPSFEQSTPVAPYAMHHPHAVMANPPGPQENVSTTSSWFSLGRSKPKYPQPLEPTAIMAAAPALSLQAQQVLAGGPYDHHDGSSAYDSSTGHDIATEYASSAHYESSGVDESVGTESIASSMHEEIEVSYDYASHQQSQQQPVSPQSWFRFGSRKPRYAMTAVQESEEPTEEIPPRELLAESTGHIQTSDEQEAPKGSSSQSPTRQSSSWFGFRRSSGTGKRDKYLETHEEEEFAEQSDSVNLVNSSHGSKTDSLPDLNTTTEAAEEGTNAKSSSSWFTFRKSRATSPAKRRNSHGDAPSGLAHPTPTESTDDSDEGWLMEVMNQPGNSEEVASWLDKASDDGKALDSPEGSLEQTQQQKWFRFLRSSKPSSRSRSRLPSLDAQDGSNLVHLKEAPTEASTFDDEDHFQSGVDRDNADWLEGVVSGGDLSKSPNMNLSWFDKEGVVSQDETESPPIEPFQKSSLFLPQSQLCPEPGVPIVASQVEQDESGAFPQDFVQGMEQNLTFLDI